jgi:biotin transporter BioY
MIVALWAALAMVAQDILGVCLVQAEARNRAHLAGIMDTAGYLCAFLTTAFAMGSYVEHGWDEKTFVILIAVSAANYLGTVTGVKIGKRWIKTEASEPVS